jgi:uncharacterized repeat protein (TIGR01451 family)
MRGFLARAIACAGLSLLLLQHAVAAGTAVGTIIENTATVDFVFVNSPETVVSNTITFLVAERIEVVVTPQSGQVVVLVNDIARSLLFAVTNTGNGTETFQLAINSIVAGDDFDPIPTLPDSIFFDTDGSGDFSTGDVAYVPGSNDPVLLADESIGVLLVNDIPGGLTDGELGRSELAATSATGSGLPGTVFAGLGDGGTDAVIGTSGGEAIEFGEYLVENMTINVVKTQAVMDPSGGTEAIPGATITYTITVEVISTGTATLSSVVDLIPTWSTFAPNSITLNGLTISDATDGDAGEYDITGAPTVVVRLGDLTLVDGLQTVVFQVTID